MKANLTNNEIQVLKAAVEIARKVGDNGVEFFMSDVAAEVNKSQKEVQGICSSLQNKGMIECFGGEYYFDAQILKSAEDWYKMAYEDFDAPAVDARVLRLNEILNTKLSSISSKKREALKASKIAARYILDNWNNAELGDGGLKIYLSDEEMRKQNEELYQIAQSRYEQLVQLAAKEIEDNLKKAEAKAETTPKAPATKKSGKVTTATKKTSVSARKVGDHHPTKPWVWTEYAPGKFDWRTDKQDKKVAGRKKKTATTTPKQPTVEEFVELVSKRGVKNLTKAQREYFKLIKKGYRLWNNDGHYFLKNADGDTKAVKIDSLESMLKKFNIEEIPSCLIR